MHAAQDAVAAGLQRGMYVPGDAGRGGHQAQQIVRKIHGLDGAEPQPFDSSLIEQPADQIR
jgi:hypothetical protein